MKNIFNILYTRTSAFHLQIIFINRCDFFALQLQRNSIMYFTYFCLILFDCLAIPSTKNIVTTERYENHWYTRPTLYYFHCHFLCMYFARFYLRVPKKLATDSLYRIHSDQSFFDTYSWLYLVYSCWACTVSIYDTRELLTKYSYYDKIARSLLPTASASSNRIASKQYVLSTYRTINKIFLSFHRIRVVW